MLQMVGHDPVPNQHRGVQLARHTDAVAGRQHSEKHSHSQFLLNEIRDPREVLFVLTVQNAFSGVLANPSVAYILTNLELGFLACFGIPRPECVLGGGYQP